MGQKFQSFRAKQKVRGDSCYRPLLAPEMAVRGNSANDDVIPIVQDDSGLTDADRTEIYRWQEAYREGGIDELFQVMNSLAEKDPACHVRVMEAFWPETVRQTIAKQLAEAGLDEEELEHLMRKLDSRLRDQ